MKMFAALPRMQGRLLDAVIKRLTQKPILMSSMPQTDTTKVDGGSVQRGCLGSCPLCQLHTPIPFPQFWTHNRTPQAAHCEIVDHVWAIIGPNLTRPHGFDRRVGGLLRDLSSARRDTPQKHPETQTYDHPEMNNTTA